MSSSHPFPLEARLGGSDGGEKCTLRLDVPVGETLHDAIATLASVAGRTKADYVRWVLEQHAFGSMTLVRNRLGHQQD